MTSPSHGTPFVAGLAPVDDALARGAAGRTTRVVVQVAGTDRRRLLDRLADRASAGDARIVSVRGRSGDSGLAYSSLLGLVDGLDEHVTGLSDAEASSLRAVAALRDTEVDPRAVRTGLRRLLIEAAADRPLILVIDDPDHLDEASGEVLAFALARIDGTPLCTIVIAPSASDHELLADADDVVTVGSAVRDHGTVELAPTPVVGGEVDVEAIPRKGRLLLATAVADATGDVTVVTAAAEQLLGSAAGIDELVARGVLVLDTGSIRLADPALGGAAYHRLGPADRRAVHAALAEAMSDPRYAEARTWQLAAAAPGHDDEIASALASVAGDALDQGRLGVAAAASSRAATLTSAASERRDRLVAAIGAWTGQGDVDALREALAAPFSDDVALRIARSAAVRWLDGDAAAVPELRAAARLADRSTRPAIDALFADAAYACGQIRTATEVAAGVLRQADRGSAVELAGALLVLIGQVDPEPYLAHDPGPVPVDAGPLEIRAALRRAEVHVRYGDLDRAEAALPDTPAGAPWDPAEGPTLRARILSLRGEPVAACRLLDATLDQLPSTAHVARAVVAREQAHARFLTADVTDAIAALDRVVPVFEQLRMTRQESAARHTAGALSWAMGRIDGGTHNLARARQLDPTGPVGDLVVALVEAGRLDDARAWLDAADTGPGRHAPTIDIARARAVLAGGDAPIDQLIVDLRRGGPTLLLAEVLVDQAARHHRVEQWDEVRRIGAEAARILVPHGLAGLAPRLDRLAPPERAAEEPSVPDVLEPLTAAERRVALAVSRGLTNRAAADELYLSVKTVDSHLQRIYPKLQIRSRAELAAMVNRSIAVADRRSA